MLPSSENYETVLPSSGNYENVRSVKSSESEPDSEESLTRGLRRRSTRRSMKKPGEKNDSPDEEKTSPVSIFAEMLVNLIPLNKVC